MFSVLLVTADSYQAVPVSGLDPTYSEFRGSEVKHVPVIRIFGSTPNGKKTCLHIHGVFPYIYVPCTIMEDGNKLAYNLATSLDSAINVSLGCASSNNQHVFKIQKVSGIPLYGYHEKKHQFFKVYFYNPAMIKKAADLLQNGLVLNQSLQPHEAHIPYILQFMIDYNIYGMSTVNVSNVKHRRSTSTLLEMGSSGDSNHDSEPSSKEYLAFSVVRQSTCEVEVDALASDILNRKTIEAGLELNPGLATIWNEERARRAQAGMHGGDSQLVNPSSPDRPRYNPTDDDLYQAERLAQRLLFISQCDENTLSSSSTPSSYPFEVQNDDTILNASCLENHLKSNGRNEMLTRNLDVVTSLDNTTSASPLVQEKREDHDGDSSILTGDDMHLVEMLMDMAQSSSSNSNTVVDNDSVLGSQFSESLAIENKSDNEDDNEIADLNLTCLELDTLSSWDITQKSSGQSFISENNTRENNIPGCSTAESAPRILPTEIRNNSTDIQEEDDIPQCDGAGDLSPKVLKSEIRPPTSNIAKNLSHSYLTLSPNRVMNIQENNSSTQLESANGSTYVVRTETNFDSDLLSSDRSYGVLNELFEHLSQVESDLDLDLDNCQSISEIKMLSFNSNEGSDMNKQSIMDECISTKTVLNGDPCFTESAVFDKSDLTELQDQYVSLLGSSLLPNVYKDPTNVNSLNSIIIEKRAVSLVPEIGKKLDATLSPCFDSLIDISNDSSVVPEIQDCDNNKSLDVISKLNEKTTEHVDISPDDFDYNCNVIATWEELQNLQCMEKPFKKVQCSDENQKESVNCLVSQRKNGQFGSEVGQPEDPSHASSRKSIAAIQKGEETIEYDTNVIRYTRPKRLYKNSKKCVDLKCNEAHDRLDKKKIVCKANVESVLKSNGAKCSNLSKSSKPIDKENGTSNVPVDASLYSHYSSYRSHSSDLQGGLAHRHVKYSKKKIRLKQCSSTNQIWVIEKRRRGQPQKSNAILCTERQCPIPVIRLRKIDLDETQLGATAGIKTLNSVGTDNNCASNTEVESSREVKKQLDLKTAKKKSLKHIYKRKCISLPGDIQPVVKYKKERSTARNDIHTRITNSNVNNNCGVETTTYKSLDHEKESNLCSSCDANNENLNVLDTSNAQRNKKQRRRRSSVRISINACPDVLNPVKIKTSEQPESVNGNVSKTGNFAAQEVTNSMDSRTRLKILLRNKIINRIDNCRKTVLRQGNVRQCQNVFCDRVTRKKMSGRRRRDPVIVSSSSSKTVVNDDCQVSIDSETYTLSNEIDELTAIPNIIESNNETFLTPILETIRPMEDILSPVNKTLLEDTQIYEHFVRNTDNCFSPNREYDVDVVTSQVPECLFEEDFVSQCKEEREQTATPRTTLVHGTSSNKDDCSTTVYHQGLDVYDEDDLSGSSVTSEAVVEEDVEALESENLLNDVPNNTSLLINSMMGNEVDSLLESDKMKGISNACAESQRVESEIKTKGLSFTENKSNEEKDLIIKEVPVYHRKVSINLEKIDLDKLKMYLKQLSKDKSISRPEEIIKFKHTENKEKLSQNHDVNRLRKKTMKMIDALHTGRPKKDKSTHNSFNSFLNNMPITEKLNIARKLDPVPPLLANKELTKLRNKVQTLFSDSKLLVATTSYNEMHVNISKLSIKQRFMYKIGLCDVHMKKFDWLPTRQTAYIQLQEPRVWLQQQSIIIPKKAKRTRVIRRQYKKKSRIPAFDGAGDSSSDEPEPIDPDITVEREEKRICTYKSSRKSAQENLKTIATPGSKRKRQGDNSDSESPRKRINVVTTGLSPKTPLRSPLRTSTLQSPGRITRTYSPLNIVITSPKVSSTRKEAAEFSDPRGVDTNSDTVSYSQSECVTPKRMRRTLHQSSLRETSVLSPINEQCEDSSSAKVLKETNSMDQAMWIYGLQDNAGTCATRSGSEARKKLDFLTQSEREGGLLQAVKEKEDATSGTKFFKDTNKQRLFPILQEEYSDGEENEDTTQHKLLEMVNLDKAEVDVIDETADELTDEEDVHNVTFTQYVDARLNQIRRSSQDLKTHAEENDSKEIDILPEIDPPSRQSVIESMESYGIPKYRNKTPFYGNESDIPAQKAIPHSRVPGMSELPNWKSTLEDVTGIRKWRRMKVDEFHPSGSKLRSNNITQALAGHEFMDIQPLFEPPSPKNVRAWLAARESHKKERSKEKTTDHQQQAEQEQRQNKQNDSITVEKKNECSVLNISNLVLSSHEATKSSQQYKGSLSALEVDRACDTEVKSQQRSLSNDTIQNNVSINDTISDKLTKSTNPNLSLYNKSELSRRLGISCGQIEGVSYDSSGRDVANENLQNVKAIVAHQYLTILCLEIHVCTRGSLLPDPQHDSISAIFYAVQNDVPATSKIKPLEYGDIIVSPAAKSMKNNSSYLLGSHTNCETIYVSSEKELLNALILLIGRTDPDIFIGWEIECLSWGFVLQRASILGLNLASRISRIPNVHHNANTDNQTPDLDALAEVKLPGRIVLNAWRLMRHEAALLSYTFESVMFHVMKERHPCPSFETLTTWWDERSPRTRWKVVDHYITRVLGTLKILDQLDLIGRTSELARLFGIQFYEVFSRGSQFRVESMMLRLAKPLNYVPVSPSVDQRAHMRAPESLPLIMEPESQFYSDPVVVLDFQSLYPSVIIAYNYCFSTCLGRIEHIGQPEPFEFGATTLKVNKDTVLKLGDNINFAPCGVAFVKPEVRRGILPRMLSEILETRLMVKKAMKDHSQEDRTLQRALHSRQLGLKLIANVTYGYTAANFSGRMPCIEIGDSVVSKGRETLERAIKIVESKPEWGARVVYGDTDSLFVLLPGKSKAEAFKVGAEIADTVTAANPRPVKLKFEKVLQPAILQTKKRYCGYMYESPDQEKPEYLAKGIETVRRDGCPAVAKILEKSLRILFDTKDVSLVKQYVTRQLTKILQGRVSIEDLTFAREFRGMQGYKASACVPALELTRRLIQKDPRAVPRTSERVRYIIVAGAPNQALIHCVRSPWELISDPGLRPNAIYYITRVIIPPLNRCFNLLGVDINAWFNEMPHHQIAARHTVQLRDKQKTTISQYFGTAACAVCGKFSKNEICHNCVEYPERVLVILHEKLRQLERSYYNIMIICQSCVKRPDNADCTSLDCPILYRRMQSRRDLEQGAYLRKLIEDGSSLNF